MNEVPTMVVELFRKTSKRIANSRDCVHDYWPMTESQRNRYMSDDSWSPRGYSMLFGTGTAKGHFCMAIPLSDKDSKKVISNGSRLLTQSWE